MFEVTTMSTDDVNYFCEFDTEHNLNESEEVDDGYTDETDETDDGIDFATAPGEEEVIFRLRRTDTEDDDYNFHEYNFKNSSHELIDIVLSHSERNEQGRYHGMDEGEYLSICSKLQTIFDSHKSMECILIRMNNDLKGELDRYKNLLSESDSLNRKISKEISDMKIDLDALTERRYKELD